jgi:hypothetical protein
MMLPWFAGVFFLIGLVIFIYIIRSFFGATTPPRDTPRISRNANTPKNEDIILSELTEEGKDAEYGILWNAPPGKYDFSIRTNGEEIASGSSTSSTNIFKVKGLPLEIGKTYNVKVGDTILDIPFLPPSFDLNSLNISPEGYIDCNTSFVPTNIEVILEENLKVSLSDIKIKMEPPGFMIDRKMKGFVVIMIYNGQNTSNILTVKINDMPTGQTPIPF